MARIQVEEATNRIKAAESKVPYQPPSLPVCWLLGPQPPRWMEGPYWAAVQWPAPPGGVSPEELWAKRRRAYEMLKRLRVEERRTTDTNVLAHHYRHPYEMGINQDSWRYQ